MKFKHPHIFLVTLIILLFNHTNAVAQSEDVFSKPTQQQLVVDHAQVFSTQELASLTSTLNQFSNETSTQILVYTTNDLQGYEVGDFAQRLGESWGIGGSEFDNGIVIVFKPKNEQPGRVTIQTGYGIEPLIPDATANQIIDNEMIPAFKRGDIYGGISNALTTIISLTKGEFTAQEYKAEKQGAGGGGILIFIIFMVTFFSIFGRSRKSRYNTMGGSRSNLPLWLALGLLGSGSSRGSGWSDFSSGSGSFGGGGGGFGGFGGGSFGGGGASGSW